MYNILRAYHNECMCSETLTAVLYKLRRGFTDLGNWTVVQSTTARTFSSTQQDNIILRTSLHIAFCSGGCLLLEWGGWPIRVKIFVGPALFLELHLRSRPKLPYCL